ncbi:MAG: hypothetical protein ACRBDL_06755 [Alphaproteobacteria bacterium]
MSIFVIPKRRERESIVDSGALSWLKTEKGIHRGDPDHFIFTIYLRRTFIFTGISLILIISYLGLATTLNIGLDNSEESLYENYKSIVNIVLPISFVILIYHFMLYKTCVDKEKYSLLYNRRNNKRVGSWVFSVLIIYPSIYELIYPSHVLWLFEEGEKADFWTQYHDQTFFLIITSFTIQFFYIIAAIMFFMCLAIADQEVTKFIKHKRG